MLQCINCQCTNNQLNWCICNVLKNNRDMLFNFHYHVFYLLDNGVENFCEPGKLTVIC